MVAVTPRQALRILRTGKTGTPIPQAGLTSVGTLVSVRIQDRIHRNTEHGMDGQNHITDGDPSIARQIGLLNAPRKASWRVATRIHGGPC